MANGEERRRRRRRGKTLAWPQTQVGGRLHLRRTAKGRCNSSEGEKLHPTEGSSGLGVHAATSSGWAWLSDAGTESLVDQDEVRQAVYPSSQTEGPA